ncbi:MAG: biotin--[acetyl-CoA-carboxylase] ligase [Anaerolineae bacterium]|nr:biotin--[acetyl-CoA-carboxylase] ligase [Anaerolineae bacterium]
MSLRAGRSMRFDVRRYRSVTSTMDVCRAWAERGAVEGLVILADEQTAGRGRVGRAWYSPPGQSLYLSVLLRPALPPRRIGWLTMLGALAVCEMAAGRGDAELSALDARFRLKWPNDVLLDGKKVAGVLVEASLTGDCLDYAVLGIGLNVNTRFDDAPEDVRRRATSLCQALGHVIDRDAVLERLLAALGARYATLSASLLTDYARRLDTLGRRVRLQVGDEMVEGDAARLTDDGALVVMTSDGERVVTFGDVMGE